MAHDCPTCSLPCHCGGDIDDIVFEGTKYETNCTCCPDPAFLGDDEFDDEDYEDQDDDE